MPRPQVGIQMYTVRDVVAKDFVGALKQVAAMGYKGVETAGGNLSAKELKATLDDLGLKAVGAHVGGEDLLWNFNRTADYWREVGAKYLITSGIPFGDTTTESGWRAGARLFEKIGEYCQKAGLAFAYHNHSFEFVRFGGKYALDILYESSKPELVKAEIDTYWVQHGGEDPVAYLKKYGSRTPLLHCKDMANNAKREFAEVGTGVLDWPGIFAAAEAGAVEWYLVEQDICPRGSMAAAKLSFENLKKFGKV